MYQNRHQGNSSQNQQIKSGFEGYIDGLRTEYNALQTQLQQTRLELEKANQTNNELNQRIFVMLQENTINGAEAQKQAELLKRLSSIITHMIPMLPAPDQANFIAAIEQAKIITPQDLQASMQQMQQQQQLANSMFSNMSAAAGLSAMMGPAAAMAAAGFNPMLAIPGVKPEDAIQASAMFQNFVKNSMLPRGLLPGASAGAVSSTGPSTSSNSVPPLNSITGANDEAQNLHVQSSSSAATITTANQQRSSSSSRPRSGSPATTFVGERGATPRSTSIKRPKMEHHEEAEGELEIDVQNDDAASSTAALSSQHTNGRTSSQPHPVRGSSRSSGHHHTQKDDRDSAHSASSSRDSTTPRSVKHQMATPNSLPGFLPSDMSAAALLMNSRFPPSLDQSRLVLSALTTMGAIPQTNGKATYAYKIVDDGQPQPVTFPPDASEGPGVIRSMKHLADLPHGEVVCAVTISHSNQQIYTGAKGSIRIWDLKKFTETAFSPENGSDDGGQIKKYHSSRKKTPIEKLECLNESYIRSCKLFKDNSTLVVGGESNNICIWDLNSFKIKRELDCESPACYAIALTADNRICFSCCADGNIIVWDLVSEQRVATMNGHSDGASCLDIAPDELKLWTGGLDCTLRSWDIRERAELSKQSFDNQIFSLGCCPTDDWIALGMESQDVQVLSTTKPERYSLYDHESCVLALKFAHSGQWFATTGKDSVVNTWRTPYGFRLVKKKELSSVLSCDISFDDKYMVTGTGDKKAMIYEIEY